MVALLESTAFGDDRGDDVAVTKSPKGDRFVVLLHPGGSEGVVAESKCSTNWEEASGEYWIARIHVQRRFFMAGSEG
jgi:hypothetical protein